MRNFDGVFIPEIGDLVYRTQGGITKYFIVLGTDNKGVTYASQIYLCESHTDKELTDEILKKCLEHYLARPIEMYMVLAITSLLPASAAYNKYKGANVELYEVIGKDVVNTWLLKSKLKGIASDFDASYSLWDLLVDAREKALKSIEFNDSLQLVKLNSLNYALLIGNSMGKDLYVRFSATERLLENPSRSVIERFSGYNRVKLKCSSKICKTGERIDLNDEAKAIVKDYMKELLRFDV